MEAARELGGSLFEALFTGAVRDCYTRSVDQVMRDEGSGLRLRLRLQDVPELADLPWEFLRDAGQGRFLAQSAQTPLVRYMEMAQGVRPFATALPLRILVMISAPVDVPALDLARERTRLEEALEPLRKRNKVEVTWLEDATLLALMRQLRNETYHIFQFVGHGAFDPKQEVGLLILEGEGERAVPVEADKIGAFLRDHASLRLAVLNSCEGARNSRTDPFAGVATNLVRLGIPAVVAMQFEISDEAAITFSSEFYAALVDGLPVDAAVAEARKAMYATSDVEWATPVLYMRSSNGVLFQLEGKRDSTAERAAAAKERLELRARHSRDDETAARRATPRSSPDPDPLPRPPITPVRPGHPLRKILLWGGAFFAGLIVIGALASLANQQSPPPAVPEQSYDIPSISANVQGLRFFESGRDPPQRSGRSYRTTFRADSSRYINVELDLIHPAPSSMLKANIPCSFYEADGTLEGSFELEETVQPGETMTWPARGFGNDAADSWSPGEHRASCSFEGRTIAEGSFTVTPAVVRPLRRTPPAPPPPPPPSRSSYDIPAVRANVTGLQFFEGPSAAPQPEARLYQQRFSQATARYIWVQLELSHLAPQRTVETPVDCVYFHNGFVWARITITVRVEPEWTSSLQPGGWGWPETGNWPTGNFRVQCSANGRVIAGAGFAVY